MDLYFDRPKITDIYIDTVVTRPERNAYGEMERTQLEVRVNRPVKTLDAGLRFVNHFIDGIVYNILFYLVGGLASFVDLPDFAMPGIVALILLSIPVYYIVGEYKFQRTIGKFLTKSVVVNEYGEPIDFNQALLRTIIRWIPFEAFSFLGSSQRGWHDKWTKTYVLHQDELAELQELMSDPQNIGPHGMAA